MRVSIIILSLISTIFATSCSVNYHLRKAILKGYKCDVDSDTITISSIDSIPYVLRDSIFWEKVIVQKIQSFVISVPTCLERGLKLRLSINTKQKL